MNNKEKIVEAIENKVPEDVVAGFSVFLRENGSHLILTNIPLEQSYVLLSAITNDMIDTITESLAAVSSLEEIKSEGKIN